MKVSFFEQWVTFYPSEQELRVNSYLGQSGPVTITTGQALEALNCILRENGISLPLPVPLGGGTEWQCYPFQAGQATHEMIITDHAARCWVNHLMMARINSQSKNQEA